MVKFLVKNILFSCLAAFLLSIPLVSILAMDSFDIKEEVVSAKSITPKTQAEAKDIVISTTEKVYAQINRNWHYVPAGLNQMKTESAFWEPKWVNIEGISAPTLILQTSPETLMDALQDLIKKPALLECTIALTTVKIFCLRELFGPDQFNHYATEFFKILQDDLTFKTEDFFHELPNQFLTRVQGESAIPGSITYITNLPNYASFKPQGNARGSNVVCTAPSQYLGFSAIYRTGPQSIVVIESQDLDLYCDPTDVERNHEEHARLSKIFKRTPSLFVESRRKAQQEIDFYQFFDLEELQQFVEKGEIYT
ncbi:MAG: hypothetical protein JSS34_08220 [Proteobacteria bacterium]|nr:hypothetical protein [Pseudomonadota bacterium]